MRSSWLASAKNRRISSWLASRSATEAPIRASIPFSAAPSLPTSLPASAAPTAPAGPAKPAMSPAVIASAWLAIVSIGRSPCRMTRPTPRKISSAAAVEPAVTISSSRRTVASTSLRLVPATSVPRCAGTVTAPSAYWLATPKLITVLFRTGVTRPCARAAIRATSTAAGLTACQVVPDAPGTTCSCTTFPRAGTNAM